MSAFSFNSHPSEAGWHKYPDTAWDSKKKQCDVLRIGGGMTKCTEGCCEVLLLMGMWGKKYASSQVDNRVIKARMGYSAGNRLPLGGFPFPSRYASQALSFWGIGRKLAGQKRSSWDAVQGKKSLRYNWLYE
jgi:hypothetical protein